MKTKIIISFILIFALMLPINAAAAIDNQTPESGILELDAPSAILIEVSSGEILFEKDAYAHRAPASVTKLMTMLLAAEAASSGAASLEENVTASAEAASMGGSQIWLEEGETMSFGEMLKCVTVVSANDCCVAIAEHLAGSEEAFAAKMNSRAAELGLKDSHFICCSGLSDSDEHYSCAHDLAMIGRELLKYDFMREYMSVWTDTIRGGEFGLSNTNKLIYHYKGATGLKTGFTSKAMHCLAASAERDGKEFIAVVLGAPSSSARFESAKKLLDHGFANYDIVSPGELCALPSLAVRLGERDCVKLSIAEGACIPLPKDVASGVTAQLQLPEFVSAPIAKGTQLGTMILSHNGSVLKEIPILAAEEIYKLGLFDIWKRVTGNLLGCDILGTNKTL